MLARFSATMAQTSCNIETGRRTPCSLGLAMRAEAGAACGTRVGPRCAAAANTYRGAAPARSRLVGAIGRAVRSARLGRDAVLAERTLQLRFDLEGRARHQG